MALGSEAQPNPSRFVVGIDLGTTNSAVAYIDSADRDWRVRDFAVPQLVAASTIEERDVLPSFHYEAAAGEFGAGALRLPWDESAANPRHAVGFFARDYGAMVPGRLVVSAKSWLCHPGVDRTAGLLPWHGAADADRLSPVEVSARYLAHVRRAWDHRFPEYPLARQDVILTVPASFDEVARELTVEAAVKAGITRVVLVEEPQAAFYAWIHAQGHAWHERVKPGQKILVCDVGGGTTDFTLIRVRRGESGNVVFHRIAVGEHLILGGDNLDLALAHHVEKKLGGGEALEWRRWGPLVRTCRAVKEALLGPDAPQRLTVNVAGGGARLIGGGRQVEVTREEARELLVEGFLPRAGLEEKPSARRSGFQEFGLPYAPDPAITKYLAAFLTAHRHAGQDEDVKAGNTDPARPDMLLFNGGFFASPVLRGRLLEVLESWFNRPKGRKRWKPDVLPNERLDLAVARGAAYYGMVRRGHGVRISGGAAQSYYIGVETGKEERSAVCLLPAGIEEGQSVDLKHPRFELLIRQPVEFPLYVSSTRTADGPGEIVAVDPLMMSVLPPIRTVLQSGKKTGVAAEVVQVNLHARRTEVGTLELWCGELGGGRRWRLQFDVRSAAQPAMAKHGGAAEAEGFVDAETVERCDRLIRSTFQRGSPERPERLVKRLEEVTGAGRHDWPASLMRTFWESLMAVGEGRRLGAEYEARWLNLLGFSLRPGYGLAVDDWRAAQTWRLFPGRVVHEKNEMCRAEWWVLWRRIAGGLAYGQQQTVGDPLVAALRNYLRKNSAKAAGGPFQGSPHEAAEGLRLLGSLELLKIATKVELGEMLFQLVGKERTAVSEAAVWALGRLGARVPVYGTLNTLVPPEVVEQWAKRLAAAAEPGASAMFPLVQMCRLTGDRYRDVTPAARELVLQRLETAGAPEHFIELVRTGGSLQAEEQRAAFGESLPRGLRLE